MAADTKIQCEHHDDCFSRVVSSRTFWSVVGLLITIGGSIAAYVSATGASLDRVEGVERTVDVQVQSIDRRVDDVKQTMQKGFDKVEMTQMRILDKLDRLPTKEK